MNNLAVIPARGGSKRIPKKNIRAFVNKPIIAYSIEAALNSGLFKRVIVSTDDNEIAEVARYYGAEVPFLRPAEFSDDHAGTIVAIKHAIEWIDKQDQDSPDAVCCIYATAPFVEENDLKEGLKILTGGAWHYVFSATHFGFPIFRGFNKHADNSLEMFFPQHFQTRSQDLPEAMHDAGQFYWGRPQAWLQELDIFERWSTVVELPRWRVQDIDTLGDWERAEIIYNLMSELKASKKLNQVSYEK